MLVSFGLKPGLVEPDYDGFAFVGILADYDETGEYLW